MNKRSEARDNYIHYSLRNWARFINMEWQDGPRENGVPASWQSQVLNRQDANFPEAPVYIDDDEAERTQAAMIRCMVRDFETAMLLTKHYRDSVEVPKLKRLRGKFWIFL